MDSSVQLKNEIPKNEKDNCLYSMRRAFTPANRDIPFLYYANFAGHYAAIDGYTINRSDYSSLLILYTESGEGTVCIDGKSQIPIRPNSVMVLDCRHPHAYHTVKAPWMFYYLHISGRDWPSFDEYFKRVSSPVYYPTEENGRKIVRYIRDILEMPNEISVSLDLRISSVIYQLLMLVLDTCDKIFIKETTSKYGKLQVLENYMNDHLSEPIVTEDLASLLYMTRPYFSTMFCRVYGIPPRQYLTIKRIDKAKQLLIETNECIAEIASKVGFSNASAFSRCFFRLTGMTPKQYREIV